MRLLRRRFGHLGFDGSRQLFSGRVGLALRWAGRRLDGRFGRRLASLVPALRDLRLEPRLGGQPEPLRVALRPSFLLPKIVRDLANKSLVIGHCHLLVSSQPQRSSAPHPRQVVHRGRRLCCGSQARQHCDHSSSRSAARIRRNDWLSVRKRACMWTSATLRRRGQTLSPGDRADPGLASVRGLDWLGPNQRREGFVHVHQTHRYAARHPERCSPARGPLTRCPADAEGRRGAEGRKEADLLWSRERGQGEDRRPSLAARRGIRGVLRAQAHGGRGESDRRDEDAEPENADNEGGALENHSQLAVPSETAVQVAPSAEAMEPVAAGPSAPRSGSKLARVIELLQRDHGATIDELIDATDWLAHTTRAALTGLRKRGYAVVIDRSERGSFYRIQADLSVGDRASVARQIEERANSAAARKLAQHSRSRARRAA